MYRDNSSFDFVDIFANMGRVKFSTVRKFRGRRKRTYQKSIPVEAVEMQTPESAASARPKSACLKKMEYLGLAINPEIMEEERRSDDSVPDNFFLLVQMKCLDNLVNCLCCPKCLKPGVKFDIEKSKGKGFASWGKLFCETCQEVVVETYLSEKIGESQSSKAPFEVNTRAAFAFMGIGRGYSAMSDWATIMNLPDCLTKNAFHKTKDKIYMGSKKTCEEMTQKSVAAIKQVYSEIGVFPDDNNVLDIAVSFDGSWQKRGHSSHNGVGIAIDLFTGLPIDYEVLSNFCHKCLEAPDKDAPDYVDWLANHNGKCNKNYAGSSNSMEQQCAKAIWGRSVEKHGLRYTTMLSDGDSKSFSHLAENKVYGDDIVIEKEECVNHVSKRMGAALNHLKDECRVQGQSITGKGKLTNQMIIKIQNYYGRAIKDNAEDVSLMKRRIFAILFHLTSTDKEPKHTHCPPGDKSWCFWQRALSKNEDPGTHKEHETLPVDVGRKLVPIFQRLTNEKLLERCKRNRTQNPNESIHNVIWRFCPKITYVGRKSVESATCMAICQFSVGATFKEMLCRTLGMEPGSALIEGSILKTVACLKKAEKAASKEGKSKRKRLKYDKISKDKKRTNKEGQTYKAGAFS